MVAVSGVIGIWGLVGLILTHTLMGGLNAPQRLPSEQFMASGRGRVLDVGSGSGRALIGLLLARPQATGTALDVYSGFFGITDNTPERTMRNARIAGVADRVDTVTADARKMPLPDASYDAAISSYAIDHMGREGRAKAIQEVARVLRPDGEFLLEIVNPDLWVKVMMPIPHVGLNAHFKPDPARWRAMLKDAGFEVIEQGTAPATLFWLARKPLARALIPASTRATATRLPTTAAVRPIEPDCYTARRAAIRAAARSAIARRLD